MEASCRAKKIPGSGGEDRIMKLAGQLKIGPVAFDLHAEEGHALFYADKAYDGFWRSAPGSNDLPQHVLPVYVRREAKTIPTGQPIYEAGKNWALWADGDSLIACSGFYGQAAAQCWCRIDRSMTSVELYVDPSRAGVEAPLRYPLDQFLTWGLLGRGGGFILHAAVAVKDGVGWVFTGRSGAGKSTISGLCHAAGWRILNDDRAVLYLRDGVVRVAGTPWHGSGRFAEDAEVNLGGIFFIHKSKEDRVAPVSAALARLALLDVAAVPWFDDAWSENVLRAIDQISSAAMFNNLYFTRTPAAVSEVERVVYEVLQDPA